MKRSNTMDHRPCQSKGAAFISNLALALCLSITGTAVAAPASQGASPAWLGNLDPEQAPAQVREAFADVLSGQLQAHQTMAGTITVTSCANSGSNTLRAAVAAAVSGDTIDLSQLTCTQIFLSSQITIPQASLTIKGKPGSSVLDPPKPKIDGTQSGRIFNHTGTGTLILENTYLTNGHIDYAITGTSNNFGGCVYSNGDVLVDGAYVTFCDAQATGDASGGGIYAVGKITLRAGLIVGNKVTGVYYAKGGGLYSGTLITVQGAAVVNSNSATVEANGFARGGGLFAATGLSGTGLLTLEHNTAEATGTSVQAVTGGGAYVGAVFASNLTVNDNHALGSKGEGGGLYVASSGALISDSSFTNNDAGDSGGGLYSVGNANIQTSTISDNTSEYGGGIYAENYLTLKTSTVADNTAGMYGGGMWASDGLTLEDSNIIGNHADQGSGGITSFGDAAIYGSTIANNTAPRVAGAKFGYNASDPITITHSTIEGNVASDSTRGSGLFLQGDTIIKNSTITGNFASNTTVTRYGAGISLDGGVQLTLSSSIVSGNGLDWNNGFPPIEVPYADDIGLANNSGVVYNIIGSHNMIGDSTVPTPADTIGQAGFGLGQTGLLTLADNGGPTLTRMPYTTSLAIDNGTDNGFSCDQRHDGFARIVGFAADIGAVEVQNDENADRIFASGFEPVSATTCN